MSHLLKVSDLRIAFNSRVGSNEVVHGINFSVKPDGQIVAILGESGSGKSVSCMSFTQLLHYRYHTARDRLLHTGLMMRSSHFGHQKICLL